MPLKTYTDFAAFKIFLLDVGLLGALSELDASSIESSTYSFSHFVNDSCTKNANQS